MNILQKIWYSIQISDNDQFLKVIDSRDKKIQELEKGIIDLELALNTSNEKNDIYETMIPKPSEIDIYCKEYFEEIPKIAYKQKRKILGKRYIVSLHELITPDSWEVKNINPHIKSELDKLEKMQVLGNIVAKKLVWTDDKNLDTSGDYYLYPNETLTNIKADCEDHAFVMCSLDLEIGGCWGFYNNVGHAFNCFIYNNELYILDTVGNTVVIMRYKGQDLYKICYIITKEHAYGIDLSASFGELAGW